MSKKDRKYYVVYAGTEPGIYESYYDLLDRIVGIDGASYEVITGFHEAVKSFHAHKKETLPSTLIEIELDEERRCQGASWRQSRTIKK